MLDALSGRLPLVRPGLRRPALLRSSAPKPVSVTREVLRFVAGGLLAALVIGGASFFAVTHAASAEAINTAETITKIGAHDVQPLLTAGFLSGNRADLAAVDQAVRQRVINGRVVRVKIWKGDGTIVYSDQAQLIGRRFDLGAEEQSVLANDTAKASVSNLSDPENRLERTYDKLLEVYVRTTAADGTFLLFESYQLDSAIKLDEQRVWSGFLPALLTGLVLLFVVQVPLAWRLARRLEYSGRQHAALLQRAIDSSEAERRRIAGDLHDGPVQNLTAVSLTLSAGARKLAQPDVPVDRDAVGEAMTSAARETRAAMTELRSLIVEIAPPDLDELGLVPVLGRLLETARERGIHVSLSAPERIRLETDVTALVYRVAQESLRNVVKHAQARSVAVKLEEHGSTVVLEIVDDGKGFSVDELNARRRDGHVGLTLLQERVSEAGGRVTVTSTPGAGTTVRLELTRG